MGFLSEPINFLAQWFRNFDSKILGLIILSMKNGRIPQVHGGFPRSLDSSDRSLLVCGLTVLHESGSWSSPQTAAAHGIVILSVDLCVIDVMWFRPFPVAKIAFQRLTTYFEYLPRHLVSLHNRQILPLSEIDLGCFGLILQTWKGNIYFTELAERVEYGKYGLVSGGGGRRRRLRGGRRTGTRPPLAGYSMI